MALKLGNTSKNSAYLRRIKAAIEHDKSHPRHNGVLMQAHHIISAEGMKRSRMDKKIEKFGYDINELPNLSFIPCTLQGACYLGVQPHRGNHTAMVDQEDWHTIGLTETAEVTTDWKDFKYEFKAEGVSKEKNRISLVLGGEKGKVWIKDIQLIAK